MFGDNRGFFTTTYTRTKFVTADFKKHFNQDNQSLSATAGVLRGHTYQMAPYAQTLLVRVDTGVVQDVLVDIRKGSPNYGHWTGYIHSQYNTRQLLVPKGFATGLLTYTPNVNFVYKVQGYYAPTAHRDFALQHPDIGIHWPMSTATHIMSTKDQTTPQLKDAELNFIYGEI